MPLTAKGNEIKSAMEKEYGPKKGEQVFYASKNKGTISGVDSVGARIDALATQIGDLTQRFERHTQHPPGAFDSAGDSAFNEGLAAAKAGKTQYDCPYGPTDPGYRQWWGGFIAGHTHRSDVAAAMASARKDAVLDAIPQAMADAEDNPLASAAAQVILRAVQLAILREKMKGGK